jgi:phenylalanyl-tRNA synthetase alpha chain
MSLPHPISSTTNPLVDIESLLLKTIESSVISDTYPWSLVIGVDHSQVVGTMKSLQAEGYLLATSISMESYALTEEADRYVKFGSPEAQLFKFIATAGPSGSDEASLKETAGEEAVKIGLGKCLKNKWVTRDKASGRYSAVVSEIDSDELVDQLKSIASSGWWLTGSASPIDEKLAKALKQRQLISLLKRVSFFVERGPNWALQRRQISADITKEMIESGTWASSTFKDYNFESAGKEVGGGHIHALMRVRSEFRQILLEMGFSEMPTNRYVESCFWNFDALFQPQSHPARDAHDTFFLREPALSLSFPEDLLQRVSAMHESGGQGSGSLGYRTEWKIEEAQKNILRTHTTAVSARMLYKLANQPGGFKPAKYFSIDRVFRNEALDATHLAEFHQVEGVVADRGLSLGDLIGIITEFFRRIGITQLRFKPAYNPYTEPSMEVFGYHPDLKKWTEIGNSGIFRPEMLIPLGLPPDVRVIAWGLSLERPTMIKYRCKNIRELFGHKVQLDMIRKSPICRF